VVSNGATTFDNNFFYGKRTLRYPSQRLKGTERPPWRKAPDLEKTWAAFASQQISSVIGIRQSVVFVFINQCSSSVIGLRQPVVLFSYLPSSVKKYLSDPLSVSDFRQLTAFVKSLAFISQQPLSILGFR
jgi:hypothetical protein